MRVIVLAVGIAVGPVRVNQLDRHDPAPRTHWWDGANQRKETRASVFSPGLFQLFFGVRIREGLGGESWKSGLEDFKILDVQFSVDGDIGFPNKGVVRRSSHRTWHHRR